MEPHRGTLAAYQPHAETLVVRWAAPQALGPSKHSKLPNSVANLLNRVPRHLQNGGPSNNVVDNLESLESGPITPKHRVQRCPRINHEKHVADIRCQQ